ncbi:TM2 domain-containing protein [Trueperella pecoris]|uniref:TM2 domain-containing protein n=1 Tax=Trueperella pecoris TaxID=2733571 RepID=UPI00186B78AA|nr:TM2 domain-containing protein [Trueperella pecoris]QOQ39501.1 TM2 domain-containing protein [Trueperella pecoris]
MKDETPRLSSSADGVHFESSPDPLLNLPESPFGPNLYAPGHNFGGGNARSLEEAIRAQHAQQRAAALRAHPSQFATHGQLAGGGDLQRGEAPLAKSRWFAVVLALTFGTFGAHNFYLGKPNRALVNIALWLVGALAAAATGSIFAMLPVISLVIVECAQIMRGTGDYR